ncbi:MULTISPECIES: xanthine dehydrogenase family protein molybdopterin-binding subunit [unclassified Helicobacter]|uniref:xanthine dehydrogenase family protein molybdopterin-binding subunit n=1 Tax=unclassified Helicobacter TaxID=2593540 RepID=UPI000CF049E0|nr:MULTISPECIES: molybdopterin cofactor-binding domain-containing protein [unclassified Helicobacter]
MNRRDFLKYTSSLSGALLVSFYIPSKSKADVLPQDQSFRANAFIEIARDNTISFMLANVEMGQGAYSGIATCIADELDAKWEEIIFKPAPVDPIYAEPSWGLMITGGSRTIRNNQEYVRGFGATLRLMLKMAAAKRLGVAVKDLKTKDSYVIYKDKKIAYGDLIDELRVMQVPQNAPLKTPQEYNLIGKPNKRHPLEVMEKITGKARFGIDTRLPNLKFAAIIQPRVFGAKIKSFDAKEALKMDGILKVKRLPNQKIAIIANTWYQAREALQKVQVNWDEGDFAKVSSEDLYTQYKQILQRQDLPVMRKEGDSNKAFKEAYKVVSAEYSFPFLAHAPMEPLNCTIHHQGDKALVVLGGQFQGIYRDFCANILGVKSENVEYQTPYLGGSFGRRGSINKMELDCIGDAAYTAKDEPYPIMTLWSREDDIQMGWYRPLTLAKVRIALNKKGEMTALEGAVINQSLTKGTLFEKASFVDGIDHTQREGLENHPYSIASHNLSAFCPELPIPALWLRSVGHTVSAPIIENIIDEAAFALGEDPLDFRIKNIKNPRFVNLLKRVAQRSNWYEREKGSGYGVAIAESFGSIVACVVKVLVQDKDYRVQKIWFGVDCGFAFNPLAVEQQMISAANFAIGYTKYAKITIKNGATEQENFYDYSLNTIADAPDLIDVSIINSGDKIGGIGEVGVPPVFAGIINALYDATKKRYTHFPVVL